MVFVLTQVTTTRIFFKAWTSIVWRQLKSILVKFVHSRGLLLHLFSLYIQFPVSDIFSQNLQKFYKCSFLQFWLNRFDFQLVCPLDSDISSAVSTLNFDSRFDFKLAVLWTINFDRRFEYKFRHLSTFCSLSVVVTDTHLDPESIRF